MHVGLKGGNFKINSILRKIYLEGRNYNRYYFLNDTKKSKSCKELLLVFYRYDLIEKINYSSITLGDYILIISY